MSTPRKPPGKNVSAQPGTRNAPVWCRSTSRMATARMPSSAGRYPSLVPERSEAKIRDDAGVIAIRAVLLTVALAACAWFGLGARAAHDQDAATNILNQHSNLSVAQANQALSLIRNAQTLNPDQALNILRAQIEQHSGHPYQAVAIAKAVAQKEPLNVNSWFVLELMSRQVDPALNRLAQARVRQLVAPVT
jgi:hypothetical protein